MKKEINFDSGEADYSHHYVCHVVVHSYTFFGNCVTEVTWNDTSVVLVAWEIV